METAAPVHIPTIDDLRVKLCYICREEERADAPQDAKRLWIHPCNCTLVAHESCLLQWIETSQQDPSRAQNALKCPQCGAAYEIESDRPLALRIFQAVERVIKTMGTAAAASSVAVIVTSWGAGLYVVSTAFGAYAVQQFLGTELYNLLLTDDPINWPWHAWVDLPLIPLTLILSRTPLVNSGIYLLPFILSWPLSPLASSVRASPRRLLILRGNEYPFPHPLRTLLFSWPPSPAMLSILFPAFRGLYKHLFKRLTKYVLSADAPAAQGGPHRLVWGREDNGIGEIQIHIRNDNPEAPPPGAGNGDAAPPPAGAGAGARDDGQAEREQLAEEQQQMRAERGEGAGGAGGAVERTTRITSSSLGMLVGGSLVLPAIANLMGALLFRLADRPSHPSALLRRFLAVRPPLPRGHVPSAWDFDVLRTEVGAGAPSVARHVMLGLNMGLGIWAGSAVWRECDPVWWRNSLGLGMFIFAKDSVRLLHLWLSKKELESRRVKSRSFEGVDVATLDVVDGDVSSAGPTTS